MDLLYSITELPIYAIPCFGLSEREAQCMDSSRDLEDGWRSTKIVETPDQVGETALNADVLQEMELGNDGEEVSV